MRVFDTVEVAGVAPGGPLTFLQQARRAWVFAAGHRPGGCLDPKLKRMG